MDTINMLLALKNCMNVCPRPQELYNRKHMDMSLQGGSVSHIQYIVRVSNRKYESMQNQSTAVFPSRSTIGKIETIPQMGITLKMFAPNAILNQQC